MIMTPILPMVNSQNGLDVLIEMDNRVEESQILSGITYPGCVYVTPESKNIVPIKSNATSNFKVLTIIHLYRYLTY